MDEKLRIFVLFATLVLMACVIFYMHKSFKRGEEMDKLILKRFNREDFIIERALSNETLPENPT